MTGRRSRGRLALALAVLLASCASPRVDVPEARPEPQLRASLSQPRADEGTDTVRAAVVNEGPAAVQVASAVLRWSAFRTPRVEIRDGLVAPREAVAFTIKHGEPRCGTSYPDEPRLAVDADGVETELPIAEEDRAMLVRLHDRACKARAVQDAVAVSLELEPRIVEDGGREHVAGNVVLVRRGTAAPQELAVVDLAGSVLLRLAPKDERLPFVLSPTQSRATLPVTVTPTHRCDGHALGNSSQTFLLSVYVTVGGGLEHRVVTVPDRPVKATLAELLDRDCGGSQEP